MLLTALCFVWIGMLLGISFLETPVKFTAPSLTLAIGLDVGRHVFGVFNKVEVAWSVAACALLWWARPARGVWLPVVGVVALVVLQTLWLRPALDARVEIILRGGTPPRSSLHLLYILFDVAKVLALGVAGTVGLEALRLATR